MRFNDSPRCELPTEVRYKYLYEPMTNRSAQVFLMAVVPVAEGASGRDAM